MSKGTLIIEGPNEITFLQVLDAMFREVGAGFYRLKLELEPGIYRVRAKVPGDQQEKLVAVKSEETQTVGEFRLEMASAAPLLSSKSANEAQRRNAQSKSTHVHVTYQSGKARCFFFALTRGVMANSIPIFTVLTAEGQIVAEFPTAGEYDLEHGWIALTIDLPPGTYAVEEQLNSDIRNHTTSVEDQSNPEKNSLKGRRGQVVFVEEGWETQVFVPWEEHPRFAWASVYMRKLGTGFQPEMQSDYTQVDAALTGLTYAKLLMSASQENPFYGGKFDEHPMLGLIEGYALLAQPRPDYDIIQIIGDDLRRILPNSPDATLIALLAGIRGDLEAWKPGSDIPHFEKPPWFAAGTESLMWLSARIKELCPSESWLADIAPRLTTGSVWTRWQTEIDAEQALRQLYPEIRHRVRGPSFESKTAEDLVLPRTVVDHARSLVERFIIETNADSRLSRVLRSQWRHYPELGSFEEFRQAVIERVWDRLEQFEGASTDNFLAWVGRIAKSIAIDRYRQTKREAKSREYLAWLLPSFIPPDSKQVDTKDLVNWLLSGLTDRERKAITLKYFEYKTPAEIGLDLECTANAASQLCFRAIQKLRQRSKILSKDR